MVPRAKWILVCVVASALSACGQPEQPGLDGDWTLSFDFPGRSGATFAGTLQLTDMGGTLAGRIEDWTNPPGTKSTFTGVVEGAWVTLDRLDDGTGFRAKLTGVTADGRMQGTFQNDPTAPTGNNVQGTWIATRK
jgi:hypothetical protein